MKAPALFAKEADLVAAFCQTIDPAGWARNPDHAPKWTAYHETAGWDVLLVHPGGEQIGIEAKLSLNLKVLAQALPGRWSDNRRGPDWRAVLVPYDSVQQDLWPIALHLGIVVMVVSNMFGHAWPHPRGWQVQPSPPDPASAYPWAVRDWPNWCPAERCEVPDYVPDVMGGHSAPVKLSPWKIKAIKLLILLERNGAVSRRDMRALGLSESRWTDHYNGLLTPGEGGYVACGATPDLKAQHPTAWAAIEADYPTWSKGVDVAGRLGLEMPDAT